MKRGSMVLGIAAGLIAFAAVGSLAQDPLKVGEGIYKLVLENERVRVMEVTFIPGAEIGAHSHPDHMAYVVEGGKIRIMKAGADPTELDLTPGQAVWIGAETHSAKNVGTTRLRLLVVELKEAVKKEMEKKEEGK